MNRLDSMQIAPAAMEQIRKGAFLTVQAGNELNTMTIGWALIGFMWGKPILNVAVRKSRHTFSIIERSDSFTVSVPSGGMERELAVCGSRSGRECDKFAECSLEPLPGARVKTPIINIPGIHFECDILLRAAMDANLLAPGYAHLYPKKDFHTLYFGAIVDCYSIEGTISSAT